MPPRLPEHEIWRILAAQEPPKWSGNLDDDCSADWAGFSLRAEAMDDDIWWWCVYEEGLLDRVVSSNDDDDAPCSTGDSARRAAERAARHLLGLWAEA